jgi:hypothetical protein
MSKVPVFPQPPSPWPARPPTSPLYSLFLQCVGQRSPPGPASVRTLPGVRVPDLAQPPWDCTVWRVSRKGCPTGVRRRWARPTFLLRYKNANCNRGTAPQQACGPPPPTMTGHGAQWGLGVLAVLGVPGGAGPAQPSFYVTKVQTAFAEQLLAPCRPPVAGAGQAAITTSCPPFFSVRKRTHTLAFPFLHWLLLRHKAHTRAPVGHPLTVQKPHRVHTHLTHTHMGPCGPPTYRPKTAPSPHTPHTPKPHKSHNAQVTQHTTHNTQHTPQTTQVTHHTPNTQHTQHPTPNPPPNTQHTPNTQPTQHTTQVTQHPQHPQHPPWATHPTP